MTPAEMKAFAERKRVDDFERGACGGSVRELRLAHARPREAHDLLVRRGFRGHRLPIPGATTRSGDARWRADLLLTPTPEKAACEYVYVHMDGGVVRLYPTCAPTMAYAEVTRGPFARKSVLLPGVTMLRMQDEACVVTDEDAAVPKALRPSAGLKFDPSQPLESHRLAEVVLSSHVIPLSPGPAPDMPLEVGLLGLGGGFTVGFEGDASDAFTRLREVLERVAPLPLIRARDADLEVFMPGALRVAREVRPKLKWPALGAVGFRAGASVVTLEPMGYEASVAQLAAFVPEIFRVAPDARLFEDVTGRDLTALAKRFPHALLGHEGPEPPPMS